MASVPTSFLTLVAISLALACGEDAPSETRTAPARDVKPTAPQVASPATKTGPFQAHYLALLEAGCDPSGIDSPIVARALRNTPFAMAGRPFASADLTALYQADGGWYQPRDDSTEIVLGAQDQRCVNAIKAHEELLRKQVCIDKQTQAALTSDHDALSWLAAHGLLGLIESERREPWTDPGFDVCSADRETLLGNSPWTSNRWSISVDPITKVAAGVQALAMPEGIGIAGGPVVSDADLTAQRRTIQGWLNAGSTVRSLDVEVLSEDRIDEHDSYEGQVVRRCVGPDALLGEGWICLGYSLP